MIKSYLKYDEFGLVEVLCMNCGTKVAERSYMEIRDHKNPDPAATVRAMTLKQLSNYRQTEMELENSEGKVFSYINPIVCVDCEKLELNGEDIMEKIKLGWKEEAQTSGESDEAIAQQLKNFENVKAKHKGAVQ